MDFDLNEEQLAIQELAREYADGVCAPTAAARDKEERFPVEELRQAGELGLMGLLVPEEYGGAYVGNLALSLAMVEVNRADASIGVTLSVHNSLACCAIDTWGSEETKRAFLPRLASGEWVGGYALSEWEAGSDAGSLQCRAERKGDVYVVNGTKAWISSGGNSGCYVLFARTDPSAESRGISAFVLEADRPGLRTGKKEPKLGIRSSSTTELLLENVEIPAVHRLGDEGQGFKIALFHLDGGRIGIACQALGIMEACLEASIKYAKEREQFDRPIAEFQPIQWKLAEMEMRIHAARQLIYRASWLKDEGRPHTREAAVAKLFASTSANWCARQAVQIHGGAGYCSDFPVERYFRDARITEIYEGTTEIQKLVIARSLLRE